MSEINKLKIVFMGTPEFAVSSLKILCDSPDYDIKAVYTQPDKPIGRKMILTPPPVKVLAESYNIPVFQPEKIRKNQEVLEHLKSLELDLIVVVAYGKILPQTLLDIPKYGCVNVHASLLEKYRGAAPIQWAIANGETITGVTTMLMDAGMDTGDMLLQDSVEITLEDTTETLSKKLSAIGSALLLKTLPQLVNKTITPKKQNHELATMAPIINKNDGIIDWDNSAEDIYNLVRAFTPWPSAYTFFQEKSLKVLACSIVDDFETSKTYAGGQIVEINKKGIIISTGNGFLMLTRVHLAGSKEMSAGDFARGYKIETGFSFSNVLMC